MESLADGDGQFNGSPGSGVFGVSLDMSHNAQRVSERFQAEGARGSAGWQRMKIGSAIN